MSFYSGTTMRIKIGAKTIFHETDASLSSSIDFKEVASKDTTGKVKTPGSQSWSLSCNSLIGNKGATASVTAGSFIIGTKYTILTIGTTDFISIGASANTIGLVFTATGVGAGTGTANISSSLQEDLKTLYDKHIAKLPVTVEFSTGAVGDVVFSGSAYVGTFNVTATNDEEVKGDFSFEGSGTLAIAIKA